MPALPLALHRRSRVISKLPGAPASSWLTHQLKKLCYLFVCKQQIKVLILRRSTPYWQKLMSARNLWAAVAFGLVATNPNSNQLDCSFHQNSAVVNWDLIIPPKPEEIFEPKINWAIYYNIERRQYDQKIKDLCRGAVAAEQYFGLEPGALIRTICIHVTPRTGGAQYSTSGGILLHLFVLNGQYDFHSLGFHEATHGADCLSELTLSGGHFEFNYGRIKRQYPEFFTALAEKNFLPQAGRFGHPGSDSKELLASLINSMQHPDLEAAIKNQKFPQFEFCYRELLLALQENLDRTAVIPENAPVRRDVARVLDLLGQF